MPGMLASGTFWLSETPDTYLDFDDLTFKASGWTTKRASLTDIGGGIYAGAPVVDLGSVTNLPGSTRSLAAEYEVTGAVDGGRDKGVAFIQCGDRAALHEGRNARG